MEVGDLVLYIDMIDPDKKPKVGILLSNVYNVYYDKQYANVYIDSGIMWVRKSGLRKVSKEDSFEKFKLIISEGV